MRALHAHPDADHPTALNDLAYMHLEKRDLFLRRGDKIGADREEKLAEARIQEAFDSPLFEKQDGGTLYLLKARIYQRHGQLDRKLDAYRKSLEAEPDDPDRYVKLADELITQSRSREALPYLMQAVDEFPILIPIRTRAIDLAESLGEAAAFQKLIVEGERQFPGNPHMQSYRGIALSKQGQHHRALQLMGPAFRRFNQQAPPPSAVFLAIPTSLHGVGESQQAREFLAIHLRNPNLPKHILAGMEKLLSQFPK